MSYERYKVDVPEGVDGRWSVRRFTVSDADARFGSIRAIASGSGRYVPAGEYTALYRDNTIVMSDTPDEIRDHLYFIHRARGRVLIAGLGLGMCAAAVLEKPEVEHVTVVDLSPEVIRLVGSHMLAKYGGRLSIVNADIFTFKPNSGERWDFAWFDIWDDICTDNLPEMGRLHRRFARRTGWRGSWCRERLQAQHRRERAQERAYAW